MTANQFRAVCDFEASLLAGSPVRVCWTNNGNRYRAPGVVAKVNGKSFRVRLTQDVPTGYSEPYRAGREIVVPTIDNIAGWSCNNRVEPPDGYQDVT